VCASLCSFQVHKFRWARSLYRNPPRKGAADFEVQPEERERVEAVCFDKARKRLQAELGVRLERLPHLLETSEFVILKAPNNAEEPFYVAQVSQIDTSLQSVPVHIYVVLRFRITFVCTCRSLLTILSRTNWKFTGSSLRPPPVQKATSTTSTCFRVKTPKGGSSDNVGLFYTDWIQERRCLKLYIATECFKCLYFI
jgi:hypothetical protein